MMWGRCNSEIVQITSIDYGSTKKVNKLRPRRNGRNFPDDIFKCIFLDAKCRYKLRLRVHKVCSSGPVNNIPALVQIMAWHRPGAMPLFELMTVSLLTHMRPSASNELKELYRHYTLERSRNVLTMQRHHYGCRCPGAKWAPSHWQHWISTMTMLSHESHPCILR